MVDLPKSLLLDLLDQAYDHKAWHGTNLRGSIRGLDPHKAIFRPSPKRHNIAEQVLHAAYWKYAVRRMLRGDKRGSFPIKGSNWFAVEDDLSQAAWRGHVGLLDEEHRTLHQAVEEIPAGLWLEKPGGSEYTRAALVQGIASHDLYHAGQIQLLKRLQDG
jgi:uncharacterized damage-inducible protein DinB